MSKIDFATSCPLASYLENVWVLSRDQKGRYAGILMSELDYPRYNSQCVDTGYLAKLVRHIASDDQAAFLSEATEQCRHCALLNDCDVGAIFVTLL